MLLAIETATARGSVALIDEQQTIESEELAEERDHGRSLAKTVEKLVNGREDQLTAFGLSIGPGSFTGLRIGLAFLKGFGLVYPRPTVSVSTLKVMAAACRSETSELPILSLVDARGGEVYAGLYLEDEAGELINDTRMPDGLYRREAVISELGDTLLVATGDGLVCKDTPAIPATWNSKERELWSPQASVLARLAWRDFLNAKAKPLADLEPKYHQLSAAERKN